MHETPTRAGGDLQGNNVPLNWIDVSMDAFLRKHDVDVGKTFAVLMFLIMVEQFYEWFFALLFRHTFSLNIGILIIYVLAKGMWQH